MEGFTTLAYLLSFPGMIATVVLLTQFFKKMADKLKPNKTKYVVYAISAVLCLVAFIVLGNKETASDAVASLFVWAINSVIVWFASMKAFEEIQERAKNKK